MSKFKEVDENDRCNGTRLNRFRCSTLYLIIIRDGNNAPNVLNCVRFTSLVRGVIHTLSTIIIKIRFKEKV